ncbi:MAG: hypothetical protein MUD02_01320 [Bacteroidales bacterium]|jgi:hypothetical protein|nr:hypothetical protein [Bacteroidales bacterium]MCU0407563.1 hypothetical protein [Bacteroidales bacterium]
MFRKIWKTLRIFIILVIIAICMPHSLLPRAENKKDTNKETHEKKLPLADSLKLTKAQKGSE